jgi:hypothetical protein
VEGDRTATIGVGDHTAAAPKPAAATTAATIPPHTARSHTKCTLQGGGAFVS